MASHSFIDETGKRYGRLSVVGVTSPRTSPIRFVCLCDCGAEVNVIGSNLRRGNSQSCGCLNREATKVSNTTHGHSANRTLSRTYAIWRGIVQRAGKRKDYLHTTVCDRWKDYTLFLQDMGEAPLGASIDRFPDQRGNYEPGNCRWATMREQQNNRTNNRLISFNGKIQTLAEWCREIKVDYGRVHQRLRLGWSVERALTEPKHAPTIENLTSVKRSPIDMEEK